MARATLLVEDPAIFQLSELQRARR